MKPVFQHLTVPVDGSTTSERGIDFALELARDGGRVSFCSVVEPVLVCAPALQGAALDPGPLLQVLDEDAALFCKRAREQAGRHGIACDSQVLHGPPSSQINAFAAHVGAGAIVIGTHGRTGLSRAMLGSVAEGIMRHSEIPVISVHEDDDLRTGPLAVALDPSPAAEAALDLAIVMAAARALSLLIVYVCNTSQNPTPVNALLERATARARSVGIATQLVLRDADVADQLLAAAEEHDCCMLVMGTHGYSPLARFILGSVATAVVERAHIPVVTVRCAA